MKSLKILNELAHLFFPHCCVVCHSKLLPQEKDVCMSCLTKIPRMNNYLIADNECEVLLAGRFPFQRSASFSAFIKGSILQTLIHQLKYNNKPSIGELLGIVYGKDLLGSDFIKSIDAIIPVPLHPDKLKKRGYNQAEEFAKGLAAATSIKVVTNLLIRTIDNPTQTKLSKNERWKNVEGIFSINPAAECFDISHVLLVDDIITTGSTLEACAKTLLSCRDIKISVTTIGIAK